MEQKALECRCWAPAVWGCVMLVAALQDGVCGGQGRDRLDLGLHSASLLRAGLVLNTGKW